MKENLSIKCLQILKPKISKTISLEFSRYYNQWCITFVYRSSKQREKLFRESCYFLIEIGNN